MSVFLDADEQVIVNYLNLWPAQYLSAGEICKRADGSRRYKEQPDWAKRPLLRLVEKRVVESDATGHFRVVVEEEKKEHKQWLSPEMEEILEKKRKTVTEIPEPEPPPTGASGTGSGGS